MIYVLELPIILAIYTKMFFKLTFFTEKRVVHHILMCFTVDVETQVELIETKVKILTTRLTKMIVILIIVDPLNRVIYQKYNSCNKNPDSKFSHITFTSRK